MPDKILRNLLGGRDGRGDQGRETDGVAHMLDGITRNDPVGDGQQALIGILGEDSMDDDADGPRESLEGELAGGFNERVAGGRDVVDEDRLD